MHKHTMCGQVTESFLIGEIQDISDKHGKLFRLVGVDDFVDVGMDYMREYKPRSGDYYFSIGEKDSCVPRHLFWILYC